jgi:hypothetical protein
MYIQYFPFYIRPSKIYTIGLFGMQIHLAALRAIDNYLVAAFLIAFGSTCYKSKARFLT